MIFQVENTPCGYIVSAYVMDDNGYGQWHRLRNFGDRQGDAIESRSWDCPNLSDTQLRMLIKNFDINVKYKRISSTKFTKANS